MYTKQKGRCDGCSDDTKPLWANAPASMACVPCEIELCQNCHDNKHKLHCSEKPEMYNVKYFYYEPLERSK